MRFVVFKLITYSSSLHKGNHDHDGVCTSYLNFMCSTAFYNLPSIFHCLLSTTFHWEDISNTQDRNILLHTVQCIFTLLLIVWWCGQTSPFVFAIYNFKSEFLVKRQHFWWTERERACTGQAVLNWKWPFTHLNCFWQLDNKPVQQQSYLICHLYSCRTAVLHQ